MSEHKWVPVLIVQGELQAELMRGLLEAQGVPVQLSEEGVARVYGFTVGPLAAVEILVPEEKLPDAKQVVADYEAGKFEALGNQMDDESETP